jgi:hypothetical protein
MSHLPASLVRLAGFPAKVNIRTTRKQVSQRFDLQRARPSAPHKKGIPNVKGSRASRPHYFSDRTTAASIAERVERILAARSLTLSEASRRIRLRYAGRPHYLTPHNFYYDLGLPGYSPRIEQVVALSHVTRYRLADWLAVFGFHLDDIPRLQAEFPAARTSVLDATIYDRSAWIPWFQDVTGNAGPPVVAPLGQLLTLGQARRIESLLPPEPSPFLYAKIGQEDTFAYPHLVPGSIVRADTRGMGDLVRSIENHSSERLFLVECGRGFLCSRLLGTTKGKVILRSGFLPFAQTELQLGKEARILGVLDWELRPCKTLRPEVPTAFMKFLNPQPLPATGTRPGLSELLRGARSRSGLSIRNASAKSRWIASELRDQRYFCAPGSLNDFETDKRLPMHIHKILSVCVLYSLRFWDLLASADFDTEETDREPMPDKLVPRATPDSPQTTNAAGNRSPVSFLSSLVAELNEIPFFLRHSLSTVLGLTGFSLRDVFWVGGRRVSFHPYLKDAVLAIVNRRLKKPVFLKPMPLSEQPLYVLLLRDGTYLLAGCSAEGGTLVVHPFSDGFSIPRLFRSGMDAEVIGKVTATLRRLR